MAGRGFCKTCKRLVSQEAASCPGCGQPAPYQPVPGDVITLIAAKRTIDAIKRIRELGGLDLLGAKQFVEELEQQHQRTGSW